MTIYFSGALNSPSTLFQALVWNLKLRLVCLKVSASHHACRDWQVPASVIQKLLLNISDCIPNCAVTRHSRGFRCALQPTEIHLSELLISPDTWNADNDFCMYSLIIHLGKSDHSSLCFGRRILKLLFWNSPLGIGMARSSRALTAVLPFNSHSFKKGEIMNSATLG